MRGQMSGRSLGVLCGVMVCVCHEPGIKRVQSVQAARLARAVILVGGAALSAEERRAGATAAVGGEVTEGGAGEATAKLEGEAKPQGLRRLRMSSRSEL